MPPPSDPQALPTTAPKVIARRLLVRGLGGELGDESIPAGDVAAAGERLLAQLMDGLSRSFGGYGAHALISRALMRAQASHPVLSTVSLAPVAAIGHAGGVGQPDLLVGFAAAAKATDRTVALEGVIGWLAEIADLLGGLVGDELAASLLEQSATARDARPATHGALAATSRATDDTTSNNNADPGASSTVDQP